MICYLRTKRLKEWALLGSFVCFKQVPVKLVWQVEFVELMMIPQSVSTDAAAVAEERWHFCSFWLSCSATRWQLQIVRVMWERSVPCSTNVPTSFVRRPTSWTFGGEAACMPSLWSLSLRGDVAGVVSAVLVHPTDANRSRRAQPSRGSMPTSWGRTRWRRTGPPWGSAPLSATSKTEPYVAQVKIFNFLLLCSLVFLYSCSIHLLSYFVSFDPIHLTGSVDGLLEKRINLTHNEAPNPGEVSLQETWLGSVLTHLQAYGFAELLSDTTVQLTELHYTGVGITLISFNAMFKMLPKRSEH